jgi:hypothetical protein
MIAAKLSALKETRPHEYLVRFGFGGAVTVMAGLIAEHFGPGPGGLFLAFPAIFPATATLIESHEKKRMAKIGHDGTNRGRMTASIDAYGAMFGCFGLAGFAAVVWLLLPGHNACMVIFAALAAWAVVSVALWRVRKGRIFGRRYRLFR